jgi:large subunit ribosomal protein L24
MNTETIKFTIKKNDEVQVIAGRDKGKTGKVLAINAKTGRITVEKINMVKRHTKPTQQSPQGGILEKETPIHYSNVLLNCAKCGRGVRHGFKVDAAAKGKKTSGAVQAKIRVCKKCGNSLDTAK